MKKIKILSLPLIVFLLLNCGNKKETGDKEKNKEVFVNENAEIKLSYLNDSTVKTHFKNNEGISFDTTMKISEKGKINPDTSISSYLRFNMGGLILYGDSLRIVEYSSMLYLTRFIKFPEMYSRSFYKTEKKITLSGEVLFHKGGPTLNGVYLKNYEGRQGNARLKGYIEKEPFPREYYSTSESPQGMFSDTTKTYFRLVMKEYEIQNHQREKK